jgi:hypothetical protein
VALVLQTLGSNQTLDFRGLGIRLLALTLWLHLTTDNELADLKLTALRQQNVLISHSAQPHTRGRAGDKDIRVYTYIIILGEAEELSDLRCALGAKTLGVHDVCQTRDVGVALLDDTERQDGQVHGDDAAADRLALALTGSTGSVAGVAVGEEQADTRWVHDSLLHGETLLVVAAGDLEDVALELIANAVSWDFSAHSVGIVLALTFCV